MDLRFARSAPERSVDTAPLRAPERSKRHQWISTKSAPKVNKKHFWSDPKLFHD